MASLIHSVSSGGRDRVGFGYKWIVLYPPHYLPLFVNCLTIYVPGVKSTEVVVVGHSHVVDKNFVLVLYGITVSTNSLVSKTGPPSAQNEEESLIENSGNRSI